MKDKIMYESSIIEIVDAVYGSQCGIERTRTGACVCKHTRCTRRGIGPMTPIEQVGEPCDWCNDWLAKIDPDRYGPGVKFYIQHHSRKFVCCSVSKEEAIKWFRHLETKDK